MLSCLSSNLPPSPSIHTCGSAQDIGHGWVPVMTLELVELNRQRK